MIDLKGLEAEVEAKTGEASALAPPTARPLNEFALPAEDDPNELLRDRYLCRGGGLLLVGPTGIGKSALAMLMMILWALGRMAFGIRPARPLKSLLVQAENDDGDLAEMRDGVIRGLQLTAEEAALACTLVVIAREDCRAGQAFFMHTLRPLLAEHRPDLAWIDPAFAYLGGDANSQKDVGAFLRNGMNPLLREFACGGVLLHHTNKPPSGKERPDWQAGDHAYLGSGSSEFANWARAVLAVRSVGSHDVFELRAAKRGRRLGWKEANGETTAYTKSIAHAKEPGVICWHEVEPETEAEAAPAGKAKRPPKGKEDLMAHVPADRAIDKQVLRSRASEAGIALNRINGLLGELVSDGRLYEWPQKRPGTTATKMISRFPRLSEDLGL